MKLTDPQKKMIGYSAVVTLLTVLSIVLGVTFPIPDPYVATDPIVSLGTTHFTAIEAEDLTATDDLTVTDDATISGATALNGGITADTNKFIVADTTGNTTIAGTLTAGSTVTLTTWIGLAPQAHTLVADLTITPTASLVNLSTVDHPAITCNTTTCIVDGTRPGDLLILHNVNSTNTITIDGTGANVECKTDKTLGAGDTLTLLWGGADWSCLALHDNS